MSWIQDMPRTHLQLSAHLLSWHLQSLGKLWSNNANVGLDIHTLGDQVQLPVCLLGCVVCLPVLVTVS